MCPISVEWPYYASINNNNTVSCPKLGTFLYQTKMCADPTLFMVHIIHHSLPLTFILITQETRSLKTFWGMRTKPWQFEKKSKLSSDTCWTIGQVTFIISHVIFCLCKLNGKGNYSRIKLLFMNEFRVPNRSTWPKLRSSTVH